MTTQRGRRPAVVERLEGRALLATTTGLQAVYFNATNFTGTSVSRVDRAIDFSWGTGAPASGINGDTFSARWRTRVKTLTSQTYRLYLVSESPVRLWIGDRLVIDGWKTRTSPYINRGSFAFTANVRYPVQVELMHGTGNASVKWHWQTDTVVKQTVPNRLMLPAAETVQNKLNHAVAYARDRIARTLQEVPTPAGGYPESTTSTGKWLLRPVTAWTSGYFGGAMWQLDRLFPGAGWDATATPWSTPLATQSQSSGDHFARIWPTIRPLYDTTASATHRQTLIAAANAKNAQFNATINAFKTPEIVSNSNNPQANFGVLIDQTLDLEVLFWASDATGNPSYRANAIRHLQTVIARMIRPDGSVFQRFFFNEATGAAIGGENWQGASNTSTWARGQAWAVYGISRIAELTGRSDFIAAARKVSDYLVSHLPTDYVPYWDFQAPGIPNTYRDSSAAAIAARGLLRLGKLTGDATYTTAAGNILASLSSPKYLTEGTSSRGVLQHAALHVPSNRAVDASIVFADYYFLEAAAAYTSG